jgi:hypothetical protein
MSELTKKDIISAAKQASKEADGPLSRSDFIRMTGITEWQINKHFPEGRWSEVKRLAGIERHPMHRKPLTNEELLIEFDKVISELNSIPTASVFDHKARISYDVIKRRFGGIKGTIDKYREWLEENRPDSPLLELTDIKSKHEIPQPPIPSSTTTKGGKTQWDKIEGTEFGAPIDFRGFRHAPINEKGVIYLFGMVSYELGFIVEAVHAEFPDCEAKRHIGKDRYQRVRIEFEYRSSNFKVHGHDPTRADMIVCWINDWPDCPLEVLELRSALDELEG